MYDEYEVQRFLVLHAIENKHGLDGKVPRTCSVGRRHDDGDAAHDEGDQCTAQPQVCRKVEAEEGQVIVQEIAQPDAEGEANE